MVLPPLLSHAPTARGVIPSLLIPQWSSGELPPTFADDFKAITAGFVLMPIVIPWRHVWRHYVERPGESWR